MGTYKDLKVYQNAFRLAMEIYSLSKEFPKHEQLSLTSQVRRSSRSVCSNIAEGYRKRRYPQHFVSKMTDADMENTETMVWIDFALFCTYIDEEKAESLNMKAEEIGRMLAFMIHHPEKFQDKGI